MQIKYCAYNLQLENKCGTMGKHVQSQPAKIFAAGSRTPEKKVGE